MKKTIDFFKSFNLFETLFLSLSLCAVITLSIVFKSDALSFVYTIVAVIAVFTLAKGLFLAPLFQIAMMALYIAQAWTQRLYGEMILYGVILIPIQIFAMISWIKNRGKGSDVKTSDIGWREWLVILTCALALIAPVYFGLRALNTNELVVSTITFIIPIISNYLTLRRSIYQYVFYILQSLVLIVLWLLPIIHGQATIAILPMAVVYLIFEVSNVYGFINWIKLSKSQNRKKDLPGEINQNFKQGE